jgi:hypothetical protein
MFCLWNWFTKRKGENMVKTYKYTVVPSGVDRNPEMLRSAVARGVKGCAFNATPCTLGDAGCVSVTCPNCICGPTHRDLLSEYLNKAEKENTMEDQIKAILKPGMVLRTRAGAFFLWIGGVTRGEVYRLELTNGRIALAECDSLDGYYDVDVVYAHHNRATPAVCVTALVDLMQGHDSPYVHCVWKRPEPVKEMTVDEISKALGYKVKVVGNEQADD